MEIVKSTPDKALSDNTRTYQIEQFYLSLTAQAAQNGTPASQLLARSRGIRPEFIIECQKLVYLAPPPKSSDKMPGTVGLFRGENVDFILAQAQSGPYNATIFRYLLMPSVVLRLLGGNLHQLEKIVLEPFPEFSIERLDTLPVVLDFPHPPNVDTQTDDLLSLIGYCKNDLKVVGGLLAGLVQAWSIGILNAPLDFRTRLTFVQGLLTLLPIPARTGITFATSVIDPIQTHVQIKFLDVDVRLPRHLMFDWATGKLLTEAPEDTYSKYILTQLRLDTSLVIEQTDRLSRTAIWRAMRKDDMANALSWISKRASLDSAIQNGQPADRNMVASVLREDPTIPDDLRVSYAKHLLSFSLAMNDATHTEIIPALAAQNTDVAAAMYEQMQAAARGEQAKAAYTIIEHWLLHPPMGLDLGRWRPLLGLAAITLHKELQAGPLEPLIKFMEKYLDAPVALQIDRVAIQMLGNCYKRGYESQEMARIVVLLAVTYLPIGGLQRLLSDPQLTAQLPAPLRQAFPYLMPTPDRTRTRALLTRAAEVYGPVYQPLLLGRLIEWAFLVERIDLLDDDALSALIKVAVSPQGDRFDQLIQNIAEDLSKLDILRTLNQERLTYLVALSLGRNRFAQAIRQLEIYQEQLFRAQEQDKLAVIVRAVFAHFPLDVKALLSALEMAQNSQLRPMMRIFAHIGALEGQNYGPAVEPASKRLTAILFADPRLISLSGVEPILRLLKSIADRRDKTEALRLASALVEYSATLVDQSTGNEGTELISRVFGLISWDSEISNSALEILRKYVRQAPLDAAYSLMQTIGTNFGVEKKRALEAAYTLRLALGGPDMAAFYEELHVAASLLIDMATVYHEGTTSPQIFQLRRSIEASPGGLSETERRRLADNLIRIAEQILRLYGLFQVRNGKRNRSENDQLRNRLLASEILPSTGIEAMFWFGGYFSMGKPYTLALRTEPAPHIIGNRSVNILLRESDLIVSLFGGLLAAFPVDKTLPDIDSAAWNAEVESLWKLLPLYRQRELRDPVGEEAQLLAQVLLLTGEDGNERSLQPSGFGRQLQLGKAQPKTVIDALRWLSGYFNHDHD